MAQPTTPPVAYLAPNPQPAAGTGTDATLDFHSALNDPTRWVIKQGVPIFKSHERKDPATGNMIRVDVPKLYRIANNMSRMERGGVPVRITLGHTEPAKPEHEQPPVGGYYRNPRVQPFGPKGEPAVVVDEWLDPQYAQQRKNFPYRSAEYYDDAESITGVALLTRDPYLDLGVVAYSRGEQPVRCSVAGGLISHTSSAPRPLQYALNPATGRAPVMYRLTLGELPMNPQGLPTGQPQPTPQAPVQYAAPQPAPYMTAALLPPQYAPPQPGPYYAAPQTPTPYGAPVGYQGPWPGPAYQPSRAQQPHSSDWQYGRGRRPAAYAEEGPGGPPPGMGGPPPGAGGPPPGMGGPPPGAGGPPGGGGSPLEMALEGLAMAADAIQQYMESESQAPQEPFPPQGAGGPPPGGAGPTMASRYGRPAGYGRSAGYGRRPQPRAPYARYDRAGAAPLTISGLPVGYQMKLDQMQYQNAQLEQGMKVLMYERDQADTQECVAEIRRLASMGYPVGEYEVGELKKQSRQNRPYYLEHIATKYAKVPTDHPPTMAGDPTPGPVESTNRPLSREEMEAALNAAAATPDDPNAYTNAINYMRGGGPGHGPTQYGVGPAVGANGEWLPGSLPDPYAAGASANGRY